MELLQPINPHFHKSPSSPNESGPFRQLNIDQIQNSQGKLMHLFRSPMVAKKQNTNNINSVASDFRKLAQKSPIRHNRSDIVNENGYKYNTELKVPLKNPPKVTVEKSDEENDFTGIITKFAAQGFQETPLKSSCIRFGNISE